MIEINYLAILLVSIAVFAISAVWYSPLMFGNTWMKIMGGDRYTKAEISAMQKKMMPMYFVQFVLTLVTMYVLSALVHWVGMASSVGIAFFMWLGFIMPTTVSSVMWGMTDKKWWCKQIAIMTGAQLVVMIIAGYVFSIY